MRPKRSASAPVLLGSEDEPVLGGRRSARWNAGLLTKRAKMESAMAAAPAKARRQGNGLARGADVGPDGEIHLPSFAAVEDYEASMLGGFKPPAGYISARPNTPAGRFGSGGPAPLYSASSEDNEWLAGVNAAGTGSHNAGEPFLKEQHLEQLFDVFEEASWHTGEMVSSAGSAYDILGYSTSVAEAEAAAAQTALNMNINVNNAAKQELGKGPLMSACVTDTSVTEMFSCEDLSWGEGDLDAAWDAVDAYPVKPFAGEVNGLGAGSDDGSHGSELSDEPPLTPNGSIEPGTHGGPPSDKDSLEGDDASALPSTPGGSGSGSADTNLDESDTERDSVDEWKSGNGKSSDLAATLKTTGPVAGNAVGTSQARGASELNKMVTEKKNIITVDNTIMYNNNDNVPSEADVALVYAYYREKRAANGGKALLPRFECPAPPSVRASAQMGVVAGGNKEEGESGASQAAAAEAHAGDKYQFVLGVEAVRRQQRERMARGEAIAAAARRRRRRACFNPAASKRRRKQQAAMEEAVTAPLTVVYEPFEASMLDPEEVQVAEGKVDGEGMNVEVAAGAGEDSDWDSDDDIPLSALVERASSPEPTLADIALAAQAKAAKAEARLTLPALEVPSSVVPNPSTTIAAAAKPSVMRRVTSAASIVLSRAHSLLSMASPACKTEAEDADAEVVVAGGGVLPLNPTTPRRRRTPRSGASMSRVAFLTG